MPARAQKVVLQTTTVRLPKKLYDEARSALAKGAADASSLNDLLIDALQARLKQLHREQIDSEFAEMKSDAQYAQESTTIAEQFSTNDRDTFRSVERNRQ
jgi:outer membrane lipopolysaccharide assembly protein LptE/RlpB